MSYNYTMLHVHTDNSLKDSPMTVEKLANFMKENQIPAAALTDHGNMMGVYEFMDKGSEYGFHTVPGVEAYVGEIEHEHMLLLPVDNIGFKAIYQAVTDSNHHIDSKDRPCMTMETLEHLFGPNSEGHGHVIATSACIAGVLGATYLTNEKIKEKIKKRLSSLKAIPEDSSHDLESLEETLKENVEKRDSLQKLAKKKFKTAENKLKKYEGKPEYEEMLEKLNEDKQKTADAERALPFLAEEIKSIRSQITQCNRANKIRNDILAYNEKITLETDEMRKQILSNEQLKEVMAEKADFYNSLFGKGFFYIELQYHGIADEAAIMPMLTEIATEKNIPMVVSNDVHFAKKEDAIARNVMFSLRYNKWHNMEPSDHEYYIKTDDELKQELLKILPENIVDPAMQNTAQLLNRCNVEIKKEGHYPSWPDAENFLWNMVVKGIEERYGETLETFHARERLDYEFSVISRLGFCDYLCIVQDFIEYARKLDPEGYNIGPGRGSAAGSLVCYLIGITDIDPLRYGLIFERFLNEERVTMPDIDVDIRSDIRDDVIQYVTEKYGEERVCRIVTKMRQMGKDAIDNNARLLGESKGDTRMFYGLGDDIKSKYEAILKANDKFKCIEDAKEDLCEHYENNPDAIEIINRAIMVEGTTKSTSFHAAGVVISDEKPVSAYIPLMYEKDKQVWKTQMDMIKVEELGLLKMDFLGLKNLSVISEAKRMIKENHGIDLDIRNLPFEKAVFLEIYAKGLTNGVFQFESSGMKSTLKGFGPDCIDDIVLLVAAYRPGPMDSIDTMADVKNGRKPLEYLVPELEPILKNTYGCIIYQEQVMEIFQKLAGYSLGQADLVRRAMSKKVMEKLMKEKTAFIDGDSERGIKGCVANGIDKDKALQLFDTMIDFAKYAFNKSHAAAYAVVSYQTAYLKYHYPMEYMCALLNTVDFKKYAGIIGECKTLGIAVNKPDINVSESNFCIRNNRIYFGLGKIKGSGACGQQLVDERNANGLFSSFHSALIRMSRIKVSGIKGFIWSGAFDSFTENRVALSHVFNLCDEQDLLKKIRTAEDKGLDATEYKNDIKDLVLPNFPYEHKDLLLKEKEYLGSFVSGHPFDDYQSVSSYGCTCIDELTSGANRMIIGAIANVRICTSKKNQNEEHAFFEIDDKTGSIPVCLFGRDYEKYKNLIKNGEVIQIKGTVAEDVDDLTNETSLRMIARTVSNVVPIANGKVMLYIPDIMSWNETYEKVKKYEKADGLSLLVFDKLFRELRRTKIRVSEKILRDGDLKTERI